MIKIRLEGTLDELAEALPRLRDTYHILSESKPYKNRGQSEYYRLYVDAEVNPLRQDAPPIERKRQRQPGLPRSGR